MAITRRIVLKTKSSRKPASGGDARYVVCIRNADCPASLERHKIYRVLPDPDAESDGDLRVVDESGEDYLYPADWFIAIQVPREVSASLAKSA